MALQFKKAEKYDAKLRLGLAGPAGSGKTRSSLEIAEGLIKNGAVPNGKIAFVDTERGSASKYADLYNFDVIELQSFHPNTCVEAIQEAEKAGYSIIIIDSLSHFWMGKDGELEQVDKIARKSNSGNTFAAWRDVTPMHNRLVDAIMGSKCHVIVTLRVKTEWVIEEDARGKKVPRKVGLSPVMKDGVEYEMDIFGELTVSNDMSITKSRCDALTGGLFNKPGKDVADILHSWLQGAKPVAAQPAPPAAPQNDSGLSKEDLFALKSQPTTVALFNSLLAIVGADEYKAVFAEISEGATGWSDLKLMSQRHQAVAALRAKVAEIEALPESNEAAA